MNDTILWRRLDLPGHEIGRLASRSDGWELSGTAVFAHEARPCRLDYFVACDPDWRTVSARVRGWVGGREVDLNVSVDAQRQWRLNGADCTAVAGALDIDLGFSPSTNLLPIRRLALAVGEEAAVRAAWLPFPALMFQPLAQVYRREGETLYRYESGGGSFVRMLEVNTTGFVMSYPGLWQADASI
ncbi:MAG: putative glycolipid-binding domain-containing protein [Deltaproteobacteria bacterium]|nr:putative glycolipid-binding domain-containing protein [Deltaproteobacteria bacterium]